MRNRGNAIVPRKIYGLRQQAVTTERSGVRLDNAFRAACAPSLGGVCALSAAGAAVASVPLPRAVCPGETADSGRVETAKARQ